jgi:hypothetical protein
MSYTSLDISAQSSKPYLLYQFVQGTTYYRYVALPEAVSYDSSDGTGAHTYSPANIVPGKFQCTGDAPKDTLQIKIALDDACALADTFVGGTPDAITTLTIFRSHLGDTGGISYWKGRISGSALSTSVLTLDCEPVFSSMTRIGLRAFCSRTCRHALYSVGGCNVAAVNHVRYPNILAVNRAALTMGTATPAITGLSGGIIVTPDGTRRTILSQDGLTLTLMRPIKSLSSALSVSRGRAWTIRTSATDNDWLSVTYGEGLFVAVAISGTGNRVMTSPDGITWTSRTSAADNAWYGVAYGAGLFVAVAGTGAGNRVMTSTNGIDWESRTSAADNNWYAVTYGAGLFVAVAGSGSSNRVMTSPNGIDWTIRVSAADNYWRSVVYGAGLFVAVSYSGTGNRVMTSPDGIVWTSRTNATDNYWRSVVYGAGLFVAVASTGTGNRVMTSPDGINWTSRASAADNEWSCVAYGDGLFSAVAYSGTNNRVMTSPDGITWTIRTSPADNLWRSIAYGSNLFAAVAWSGTGNRAMTSATPAIDVTVYRGCDHTIEMCTNTFANTGNFGGNPWIPTVNPMDGGSIV